MNSYELFVQPPSFLPICFLKLSLNFVGHGDPKSKLKRHCNKIIKIFRLTIDSTGPWCMTMYLVRLRWFPQGGEDEHDTNSSCTVPRGQNQTLNTKIGFCPMHHTQQTHQKHYSTENSREPPDRTTSNLLRYGSAHGPNSVPPTAVVFSMSGVCQQTIAVLLFLRKMAPSWNKLLASVLIISWASATTYDDSYGA